MATTTSEVETPIAANVDEGGQPRDTEERTRKEGKAPMKEGEDQENKPQTPPTRRSPSSDPGDGDDGDDDDDGDEGAEDHDDDEDDFDVTKVEAEVEDRVQWEVHNRLMGVKRTAVVNTQRAFS